MPQPEAKEFHRREDIAFVNRAVRDGVPTLHTNEQLSVYYQGTSAYL